MSIEVSEQQTAPPAGSDAPSPAKGNYPWVVVGTLFVGYTFSAIDARVLTLLVEPIQRDLGLTDFEMGLLQGFAFALLFSLASIPIGRYVDRAKKRSKLLVWGVMFWSAMTAACGLATGFIGLFIARMGVGVGEATLSPTAYSLISDYFDRKRRALAISFYALGYPIGGGLALLIGGALLTIFTNSGGLKLPFFETFEPWQAVFLCVALPGGLVAFAMSRIKEPPRRELASSLSERSSLREALAYVLERKALYGSLIGSVGILALLAIGTSLWFPTFLIRTYGMSAAEVGLSYGLVMLICGAVGTLFGGWLSGRLMLAGRTDANLQIVLFATLLKAAPLIAAPLMPTPALALTLMAVGTLVGQASQGVMMAAIQDVTPNQLRGQVTGVTILVVNLVGSGLGASVIAAITDFGFGDQAALRYSIAITGAIALPVIVGLIFICMPHYRRAIAAIEK